MNPVNATAQYVSACRSVLQCDPRDPQSLAELFKVLPFFRQSLCCLVCENLLKDPMAPANSSCQHYVCKACKGKKMIMKPSCSWCKDYEQFEESKQLCILVECYKKLCEYIAGLPLAHEVASSVVDCPEVLEVMKEGLPLTECEPDESHLSVSLSLSHSPTPSASETDRGPQLEASPELQGPLPKTQVHPPSANELHECNGLGVDELAASAPSPEDVSAPIVMCAISGEPLPVCEAVAAGVLCTDAIDMYGFAEDVKHGGPLLLSVEEVLRRLDPEPDVEPDPVSEGGLDTPLPCTGSLQNPNGPFAASRQPSFAPDPRALTPCHPQPPPSSCAAATPKTAWTNRKRSRSESDSEKIQPLPIASIILGPRMVTAPMATMAVKREADVPAQPTATVTNGGVPKVSKLLLVSSSKGLKKNPEHGAKKAYTKARQGVPKTKDKTKDRLPGNSLESGNPTKVVYKKPQEKKGCKCGRATQNPSVLTCRGQRCPCYSNRKACLDCICRGCQNSYMANGEKKLEAFAVPEKALEQTRLTLGINVTSIAVRNAGASASVLNAAVGAPVASFLTASSHNDVAFDETLDLRF